MQTTMYERHHKRSIGKSQAIAEFVKQGYEVFLPFDDRSPCDPLVMKDGKISRVSIKYTAQQDKTSQSWLVELRTVSRRNHGAVVVKLFDKTSVDLLAVYVSEEDGIVILNAADVRGATRISIRMGARAVMGRVANP